MQPDRVGSEIDLLDCLSLAEFPRRIEGGTGAHRLHQLGELLDRRAEAAEEQVAGLGELAQQPGALQSVQRLIALGSDESAGPAAVPCDLEALLHIDPFTGGVAQPKTVPWADAVPPANSPPSSRSCWPVRNLAESEAR